MNPRDRKLAKKLLDILHERAGKPAEETELFGELTTATNCTRGEFSSVVNLCDGEGWLSGVRARFGGRLWAINDEGEIARQQL